MKRNISGKLIPVTLAGILALSLTACAGTSGTGSTSGSSSQETPQEETAVEETEDISETPLDEYADEYYYTGEEANISIKAWRTGADLPIDKQKIHVTVSDNGIGIPEDSLSRIFDRFYRAKNSGVNIKGTGLGLAIVKLICDKHEARITVQSKIGIGTTFEVVFNATN